MPHRLLDALESAMPTARTARPQAQRPQRQVDVIRHHQHLVVGDGEFCGGIHDRENLAGLARDWEAAEAAGRSLAPYIRTLNSIRRRHPALHQLRNLRFHTTDNDQLLAFSKRTGDDVVVVVCTTDPHGVREGVVRLDLDALGATPGGQVIAHDLVSDTTWVWDDHPYVRLDPHEQVAHIVHIRPGSV